jgi:hypothetical protein
MVKQSALVERPVACSGRGQYVAVVHYGSPGGDLYERVFKYSHKDPRKKGEADVLRDITQMIEARYRSFIITISVVKRCLHPKSDQVPKADRLPHYERVFSWVIEHDSSVQQAFAEARRQHLDEILEGHKVHAVHLPYTEIELRELPVKDMITTNYWQHTYASVELRGVERRIGVRHLVAG